MTDFTLTLKVSDEILDALKDLTKAINGVGKLTTENSSVVKSEPKTTLPTKKKPETKATKADEPELSPGDKDEILEGPPLDESGNEITIGRLRGALKEFATIEGIDAAKALIKDHEAVKITDLTPASYKTVFNTCLKVIEGK